MRSAQLVQQGRAEAVRAVLEMLQEDMRLVCVTAVEDRLQASSSRNLHARHLEAAARPRGASVGLWHQPQANALMTCHA